MTARTLTPKKLIPKFSTAAILLLFTVALLLIASGDGWFRMQAHRTDVAWFFMCGKSWMSGLIPYTDFADSKGPLLWLIYGLGYLISPHNLYGVFIFEILFYWATFTILFKAADLFLHNRCRALISSMAIALIFFAPGIHQEILVEDYAHLFNAVAFYLLLRNFAKKKSRPLDGLWFGLICGAALLTKFSYAFTLGVPALCLFVYLIFKKGKWLRFLLLFAAGIAAITLPFVIYFLSVGAFDDFIREYFLNTFSTISTVSREETAAGESIALRLPLNAAILYFRYHIITGFMWIVLVALCLGVYLFRKSGWLAATLILWYIACVGVCAVVGFAHFNYFLNLSIFSFGGIMLIASLLPRLGTEDSVIIGGCLLVIVAINSTYIKYSEFYHVRSDYEMNKQLDKVAYIINQKEKELGRRPTLSYYYMGEKGEHILTNAVAGGRYWSVQAGMTPRMLDLHEQEIFSKRPDFIIVEASDTLHTKKLEENGYEKVLTYELNPGLYEDFRIFSSLYTLKNE